MSYPGYPFLRILTLLQRIQSAYSMSQINDVHMMGAASQNMTILSIYYYRVDLGVMVMKGYSTLPRYPKLLLHHHLQFSDVPRKTRVFWGEGGSLQGIQSAYSMPQRQGDLFCCFVFFFPFFTTLKLIS